MTSILGGPPKDHGPIAATHSLLVHAWLDTLLPICHLNLRFIRTSSAQYLVFFILFNTSHGDQTPKAWAFMDALILILVLMLLYLFYNNYMLKNQKKNLKKYLRTCCRTSTRCKSWRSLI